MSQPSIPYSTTQEVGPCAGPGFSAPDKVQCKNCEHRCGWGKAPFLYFNSKESGSINNNRQAACHQRLQIRMYGSTRWGKCKPKSWSSTSWCSYADSAEQFTSEVIYCRTAFNQTTSRYNFAVMKHHSKFSRKKILWANVTTHCSTLKPRIFLSTL